MSASILSRFAVVRRPVATTHRPHGGLVTVAAVLAVLFAGTAHTAEATASHASKVSESSNGVYIAIMDLKPVIAYEGDIAGFEATKPGKGQKINPRSAHVRKYVGRLKQLQGEALDAVNASPAARLHSYTIALNGFAARLTLDQAERLAGMPEVVMVLPDTLRQRTTDSSPAFLGLTDMGGPYLKGFDGEGVIVGVIDDGIWPEHPSFADDGTYASPPVVLDDSRPTCEFGNTAHNPADAPFSCNNKLIGARQMLDTYRAIIGAEPDEFDSARDDNGHGTHTASTAAGNAGVTAAISGRPIAAISGIAPRAHVIAYKGLGNLGGFTSDLAAAIDQAVADGVDVINYSIGGGAGGPGADELAFLFAADLGVHVATSAGNSGPSPATLGNPGTMPWLTTVGASTQPRFWQGTAVSSDGWSFSGASVTMGTAGEVPLIDAGDAPAPDVPSFFAELCFPESLDPNVVTGKIVLCRRGAIARASKSFAVLQAGGVGMILYNNDDDDNLFTDTHWVPSVHINNSDGLAIKSYIAGSGSPTASIVAGGATRLSSAPSMAYFSSRGPNPVVPDIIKPDITAPGHQILAGYSPFPDPGSTAPGNLFAAISGTSMSSPHVAGIFALLKQAHPDWSPAVAKSALMTTAYQDVRDSDRVSLADPFDMGAGHADPGGMWSKGSIDEPGLAYQAGVLDYLGFLCDTFPYVFVDPAATCGFLASQGIPTEARNLNYPSIGIAEVRGSQTVIRTVTSVAKESGNRSYRAVVDAPPGFDVTVEPAIINLKSGESATYAVTITDLGGIAGEWRFGSLTWVEKSADYAVYSPIAVKAVPTPP